MKNQDSSHRDPTNIRKLRIMIRETQTDQKPWYKQPLVWLVISIPATSVVLGITLLTLAINTDDSLVIDDYYKHGKQINRLLARDQYASALGLSGALILNKQTNTIQLTLHSKVKLKTKAITLRFLHPTRNKQDRILTLKPTKGPQQFEANLPPLRNGRWYVQLESRRWRLVAEIRLPRKTANSPITLKPSQ